MDQVPWYVSPIASWLTQPEEDSISFPEYYEDPDYRKTQDYLRDLGINILEGDIPDYYKGIGEAGGSEFENYLNLMTGDIKKSVLETAAATGRGGGAVEEMMTQVVGPYVTESRYNDFLRALEGKSWLFSQGKGITEGVRSAGQVEGANRNTFNLAGYNAALGERDYQNAQEEKQGQLIGDLLSRGVGAVAGYSTGGVPGAVAGAMGGIDWTDFFKAKTTPSSTVSSLAGLTGLGNKEGLGSISGRVDSDKLLRILRGGQ